MKQCRKCNVELIVGENWLACYKIKNDYMCSTCRCKHQKQFRDNVEDKHHKKQQKRKYDEDNKRHVQEYRRNYWKYASEEDKIRWNINRKPKDKQKRNIYEKNRREIDLNYKISGNLRSRLGSAIRNNRKSGSAVKDLGMSIDNFKIYLEERFEIGMTWENYGSGWHIDHIEPLRSFDLTIREQLLEAVNYKNLRPLWAIDNLKKISEDKKKSFRNKKHVGQ